MGRQYGALLGERIPAVWWAFMEYAAQEFGLDDPALVDGLLGQILDQVWDHMRPYIPVAFVEELGGIAVGAAAAGADYNGEGGPGVARLARRMVMMVEIATLREMDLDNLAGLTRLLESGRSEELVAWLAGEVPVPPAAAGPSPTRPRLPFATCSFFAAWGPLTQDGRLYASRNLDWTSNAGLNEHALVTVYMPDEGYAYATLGYVGLPGAIAGMSENGMVTGHVGSASVLERLQAEPGMYKSREGLWLGESVDGVLPWVANQVGDGVERPNSIGANAMMAWGDPLGAGAGAQAAAIENNGGFTAVFLNRSDCSEEAYLYTFDSEGALSEALNHEQHPDQVNLEGGAFEIDAAMQVRHFVLGADGRPERDPQGLPVEAPDGDAVRTGLPIPCAVFRGDEALAYGVRRWQEAANGPWRSDGRRLMIDSGSYRGRYLVQHDMLRAYADGTAYSRDGVEIIPPADGVGRLIGDTEALAIANQAAMSSNILSVVYDATSLQLYVAYEKGHGDEWEPASRQEYTHLSLRALLGETDAE